MPGHQRVPRTRTPLGRCEHGRRVGRARRDRSAGRAPDLAAAPQQRRREGQAMTVKLKQTQNLPGVGVVLALFMVWRFAARRARKAADAARASARVVSLAGRVLFTGTAM